MDTDIFFKERGPLSQKGQYGKVLVVAGSMRYTGSAVFNAVSALRSGADLVTVIGPRRAVDVASTFLPDIITVPLDSELGLKDVPLVIEESKSFDSLVVGGGLNRSEDTHNAIREIVKESILPTVIDAEAIRAVAEDTSVLKGKQVILTPHFKEFEVISGIAPSENRNERENEVKDLAHILGSTVILKSGIDIISDGEEVRLNKTGTPFMTKGGFGDTLSGICGALLARNSNSLEAAYLAAYINGRAGEMAADIYGESVLASDLFQTLPKVIKDILTE